MTLKNKIFAAAFAMIGSTSQAAIVEIGMGDFDPGAVTYNFDGDVLGLADNKDFGAFSVFPIIGTAILEDGSGFGVVHDPGRTVLSNQSLEIHFDFSITQFGLNFGSGVEDTVSIEFYDGANLVGDFPIGVVLTDNWKFHGYGGMKFDRVHLTPEATADWTYAFYDVKYTAAAVPTVPLPAGLPLLFGGLGLLAMAGRRRKTA